MALLFIDSFEHYSTSQLPLKWDLSIGGIISSAVANTGTKSLSLNMGTRVQRSIAVPVRTIIVGWSHYQVNFDSARQPLVLYKYGGQTQVGLYIEPDGRLTAARGSPPVVIATSTQVVPLLTWTYIEFKAEIGNYDGSVRIRINGTQVVIQADDTQTQTAALIDQIDMNAAGRHHFYVDDFYLCDHLGVRNNNFIGPCKIYNLVPDADGYWGQWDPLGGGSHFIEVDEMPPEDDTDYVASASIGDKDSYSFSPLAVDDLILGTQLNLYARQEQLVGTHAITSLVRQDPDEVSGSSQELIDTYRYYTFIHDLDPLGQPWVKTNLNTAEFGIEITQ